MGPAASSTLAVKFCATALVMQCTRGRRSRKRSSVSAAMSGRSLCGACISLTPSAGMTRIRFDGLAGRPLSAAADPPRTHEIARYLAAKPPMQVRPKGWISSKP